MVLPVEQPVGLASNLPGHLLTRIFLALDFKSKLQAELTCRHWHKVLASPEGSDLWGVVHINVNFLASKLWALPCSTSGGHAFGAVLRISRWLSSRGSTGGIAALDLRASFSAGTATQAHDAQDRQVIHVLHYLLPTLAATLGAYSLPIRIHLEGNAIHSTPVFSPSFVHILRRHVQELHLLRVTGPLSASFLPLAQLSQLTHLQILAAPECSLQDTAADDCLSQILALLPRLEHLELSSHQPVLLSSHLSSLQRLEYLEIASEIGGGFLSALPSMPALTSLVLNRLGANDDSNATPLSTCKTSMQALASLQHLTLANFVLPGEESELCGLSLLTGLTSLGLPSCRLARDEAGGTFSAMLAHMKRLMVLDMRGSAIFAMLSLGPQLQSLCLASMALKRLPGMGALRRLQHLDMQGNQLRSLPYALHELSCLTHLNLAMQSRKFQLREPLHFLRAMPGLAALVLQPQPRGHEWDVLSVFHIAAGVELAKRVNKHLQLATSIFWAEADVGGNELCAWHML